MSFHECLLTPRSYYSSGVFSGYSLRENISKMDEAAAASREREAEDKYLPNFGYFRDTWIGRLKIVEFFSSLLTGALVPTTVFRHGAAFSFMSFVAWTTLINVVIDIILHLAYLWDKLTFLTDYPEILVGLCALGSFSFFLASVTELAVSSHAEDPNLGRASAVFGLVCFAALAIECYLYFCKYRNKTTERRERQERVNTQTDDPFTGINHV